jgi:hypothetical protein
MQFLIVGCATTETLKNPYSRASLFPTHVVHQVRTASGEVSRHVVLPRSAPYN